MLELGFVGGGINSAVGEIHKIASQMGGDFRLVAGCFSRNKDINNETASKWGVDPERVHQDWEVFLENEYDKVDALVVLTPTPFHKDIVLKALDRNIPIICEKAIT